MVRREESGVRGGQRNRCNLSLPRTHASHGDKREGTTSSPGGTESEEVYVGSVCVLEDKGN